MRKPIIFSIIISLSSLIYAQNGWIQQTSGISQSLRSVHFVDVNNGWAVGNYGKIIHTNNGGENWNSQTSGTSSDLRSVFFISENEGWVAGYSGEILHTTNGGSTWTSQNTGTNKKLKSIFFADPNNGWSVGYSGTILHTTNGGTSWSSQTSGTPYILRSVYFADTRIGWCVSEGGKVLFTDNYGNDWISQTSGTSTDLRSVIFIDSNNGWAAGDNGKIIHTSNGGTNWNTQNTGTTSSLKEVFFIDNAIGWAVGYYSEIIYTINGGNTWENQESGISTDLKSVYFITENIGWIVGDNGKILYTNSGGIASSAEITADFTAEPVTGTMPLSVNFSDLSTTENTEITSWLWDFDDGSTSELQNPTHIFENSGEYDITLTISDGNLTDDLKKNNYIQVSQPLSVDFYALSTSGDVPLTVYFSDLSFGNPISWQWDFGDGNQSSEQHPVHIYQNPGIYTVLLEASDGFDTLSAKKENYISVSGPIDGDFTADVNEGEAPLTVTFTDISFGEPTNWFWNFGDSDTSIVQNPIHEYLLPGQYSVTLIVSDGTNFDTIIKENYISVNSTKINESAATPNCYNLYQNFPNPFNPVTTIKFSTMKKGHTILSIYNIKGQLIYNLLEETISQGEHNVRWDASNHEAGIYLIKLISDDKILTRKCVFLK